VTWDNIGSALAAAGRVLEAQEEAQEGQAEEAELPDQTPQEADALEARREARRSAGQLAQDTRVNGFRLLAELSELKRPPHQHPPLWLAVPPVPMLYVLVCG